MQTGAVGRILTSVSVYLDHIPDTYAVKELHPADDTLTGVTVL
jgi:hypothetical protein